MFFVQVTEAHQLGVDLLTVDKSGMTGLHYAIVNNHKEVVAYLIEKGICSSFTVKDVSYFILKKVFDRLTLKSITENIMLRFRVKITDSLAHCFFLLYHGAGYFTLFVISFTNFLCAKSSTTCHWYPISWQVVVCSYPNA